MDQFAPEPVGAPQFVAPVVVSEESPTLAPEKKAPRGAPKWEVDARERVKGALRKFHKPLADLVARDANEGDTRLLITDVLCYALGYDKYEDLTTEYQVKGEFADYGIRIRVRAAAWRGRMPLRRSSSSAVSCWPLGALPEPAQSPIGGEAAARSSCCAALWPQTPS